MYNFFLHINHKLLQYKISVSNNEQSFKSQTVNWCGVVSGEGTGH